LKSTHKAVWNSLHENIQAAPLEGKLAFWQKSKAFFAETTAIDPDGTIHTLGGMGRWQ
jgi:hypothetical protein